MEMLGRTAFPRIGELPYLITLPPYGFFWFLLADQSEPDHEARVVPRETITLVWSDDWNSPLATRERFAFEHDVLPHFLMERRWFADKARGVPAAKLETVIRLERDGDRAPRSPLSAFRENERPSRPSNTPRPAICFR